ncbi:GTP-binding protein [Candidatus Woesearchaeota archaeon]|jgi:uncharacterized protein|nr:GTP-binding protein [Candidatus Woesearchaeota archaeon]
MPDYNDRIKEFEDELRKTKYNKRTQHSIGLLKAKIAVLKDKEVSRGKKGKKGEGYSVKKSGDGTVIMVGFPSAGKSSLLNAITNANSPVGAYEFTTLDVVPGLMEHKDAKIQILDVPGIVRGAASGRGRGREVLSVIRNAELVLIIVDVTRPEAYPVIQKEIYDSHVRLNQSKPDIRIRKKMKNGIRIGKTVRLPDLNDDTIKLICKEFRISNAEILIRTPINADQLIDMIEGNKKYLPSVVVLNKIDLVDKKRLEEIKKEIKPDICISVQDGFDTEEIKEIIFQKMNLIRVYCKETGKKADLDIPLIIRANSTIETMCRKLHKDFVSKFRFAKVWGPSSKFGGQILRLKHKLKDTDIVEIHLR